MGVPDPDAPVTERICELKRVDVSRLTEDFNEFKEDFKDIKQSVDDTKEVVTRMQSSLTVWQGEHDKLHTRSSTAKSVVLNGVGILFGLITLVILLIKSID